MTHVFTTDAGPSLPDERSVGNTSLRLTSPSIVASAPDDVVLAELTHRWFNTLAVLSGSIRICGARSKSLPEVLMALAQIDQQILALAAMHRRLYQSPRVGECLENYSRALCLDVVKAFGREDVTPCIEMCDVSLSRPIIQRLATIIVELMTNALKHGRAPKHGAIVWMRLRRTREEGLELTVTDNFDPPEQEPRRPSLVEALVKNISGDLSVQAAPGYATRIRFPIG